MKQRSKFWRKSGGAGAVGIVGAAVAALALLVAPEGLDAQGLTYSEGQSISPAYEGWTENEDGSYNLIFGYMNRNWEETPDVPVGPNNNFSPGPADRGQPTHFLPRRNRFVFEVRVPADFTEEDELIWTLDVNGEEKKAYGTLRADYFLNNVTMMSETGTLGAGTSDPELRAQEAPEVELETDSEIEARVGQPVRLVASITDDGLPEPGGNQTIRGGSGLPITEDGGLDVERAFRMLPIRITVDKIVGLHMTWFPYRGPEGVDVKEAVHINPPQVHPWEDTRPFSNSPWAPFWVPPEIPEDGRWEAEVTFSEPGTYVL
ncbi:MAG: hypothetical protein R3223_11340, partial [Longimicrobiales bacterium]|nr:hypothetical protein [Longimicrobiales bacterium]